MIQEMRVQIRGRVRWWFWPLLWFYVGMLSAAGILGLPPERERAMNDRFTRWCADYAMQVIITDG